MKTRNVTSPRQRSFVFPAALFLALSLLFQQSTHGQQEAPSGFSLRTDVNRVLLDVTVRDNKGQPVLGLTSDSFRLEEDGVVQKVLSFESLTFSKVDYTPPRMPEVPADTFLNLPSTPEQGPLYILLLDLVNTPVEDQMYSRQQLIRFLQNKPPGARIALFVWSDGVHLVQGFTSNKHDLLAAVDVDHPKAHMPRLFEMRDNFGAGDKLAATSALGFIADYVGGLPGRKNLIWLAGDFPLKLFSGMGDPPEYQEHARKALQRCAVDRVAIFPVDARALPVTVEHAPAGSLGDTSSMPVQSSSQSVGASLLGLSYQTQDEIAKVTGGRAFYSTNAIDAALENAIDTGGTYYTLTYAPTDRLHNGKLRHIQLSLDKPDTSSATGPPTMPIHQRRDTPR